MSASEADPGGPGVSLTSKCAVMWVARMVLGIVGTASSPSQRGRPTPFAARWLCTGKMEGDEACWMLSHKLCHAPPRYLPQDLLATWDILRLDPIIRFASTVRCLTGMPSNPIQADSATLYYRYSCFYTCSSSHSCHQPPKLIPEFSSGTLCWLNASQSLSCVGSRPMLCIL